MEQIEAYKETLKADLANAIEQQEQEQKEEYNKGREDALRYALEMLEKHLDNYCNCPTCKSYQLKSNIVCRYPNCNAIL